MAEIRDEKSPPFDKLRVTSFQRIFCPAKINLFLRILGKRSDGFHELESLFVLTDLADELEAVLIPHPLPLTTISGEFGEFVDSGKNLMTKILDFFAAEFGVANGLQIKLTKNVPVGAGLGGGSSDAACFIKVLNKIFALNLDKESLQKIALRFGSDIPFFFEERACLVGGRGEVIENFSDFAPLKTLLIYPKIGLSTKEIYQKLAGNFSPRIGFEQLKKMSIFDLLSLPNDLEKPAISALALIQEILSELRNFGADFAKMSGSGSACFGVFFDEKELVAAEKFFAEKFPNFFRCVVTLTPSALSV
ncbi:MAG: 4-(cytidine 5'-diphospho)-2-C-methyl-D-erythritol kinase [Alphaproteobacteria bacterium]|nr:4-(cytidine 5'-diphospho)-2-C-methyl-D-erythritol kinase [Alphaproteobacteria bacterium]